MLEQKVKNTLKCMIIGTAIYNIVILIISIIVGLIYCNTNKIVNPHTFILIAKNSIGVILGFIWSSLSIYIMARTLDTALSSQDEKYAKSHVALISTIRLVIFCILLVIFINENVLGLAGGLLFAIGSFGTKIGTYLVPVIEKKIEKKK